MICPAAHALCDTPGQGAHYGLWRRNRDLICLPEVGIHLDIVGGKVKNACMF